MLGYLDALIAALSVRDGAEVGRLLEHPLSRLLPADVRDEAGAFRAGTRDALAAPLRAMQLRHLTAELLRDAPSADQPEPADRADRAETSRPSLPPLTRTRRTTRAQQIELPLSA